MVFDGVMARRLITTTAALLTPFLVAVGVTVAPQAEQTEESKKKFEERKDTIVRKQTGR